LLRQKNAEQFWKGSEIPTRWKPMKLGNYPEETRQKVTRHTMWPRRFT
jgi:hypothetical protein